MIFSLSHLKKEMIHCDRLPVTQSLQLQQHDSDARQMEQKLFVIFLSVINLYVSYVLHKDRTGLCRTQAFGLRRRKIPLD